MKSIIVSCLAAGMLSGCYVVPVAQPTAYYAPAPTQFVYEEGVVYPTYASAYVWDAGLGVFFFVDAYGHRHFMPRGWDYMRHGIPHGVYHRR